MVFNLGGDNVFPFISIGLCVATRAQLSASLPPAVKYISLVFAPRDRAMVSLAGFTACLLSVEKS